MIFFQWLKVTLPVFSEYLMEFLNPKAEEKHTTKGERVVALIIAVLVLCLTTLLDRTIKIANDLDKTRTELRLTKKTLEDREELISNINFYLDRADARIKELTDELIERPNNVTVKTFIPPNDADANAPGGTEQKATVTVTPSSPANAEPIQVEATVESKEPPDGTETQRRSLFFKLLGDDN